MTFLLIIFFLTFLIFVVDLENKIIPDTFVFLGILATVIYLFIFRENTIFASLFTGFLMATLLMFLNLITRGRGMGLGDVKFAVFGGLFIGLTLSLVWLLIAFLTGAVTGIILILGRRVGLKDEIAFGPFLIFALWVTYFFGDKLLYLFF